MKISDKSKSQNIFLINIIECLLTGFIVKRDVRIIIMLFFIFCFIASLLMQNK